MIRRSRTSRASWALPSTLLTVFAACIALDAAPALAADARPSTGREIVARFIEGLGGSSAIAAVDSFHVTGRYELPAFGLEGTLELFYSAPDKLVFDVQLPGVGRTARGTDGHTFWSIDPQQGARILEGEEITGFRKWLARGFSLLPRLEAYSTIGDPRLVDCSGGECYEIELALRAGGAPYRERYDVETGMLVERTETALVQQQEVPLDGWVSDYRAFGNLRIATTWKHRASGQEWTATYETVELGEVDPTVFELPEEVRLLRGEVIPSN